ncbi:MAG: diadenylate cyclase CdaA [Prevotella sp.]|nr:diadenylate cyclase CdaA [Prevotella sp.]
MIEFGLKDFIDILLVAIILYYSYRLMRESKSINVFVGIIIFVVLWVFVSQILEMKLLGSILDKLVSVGVIAIIVIFQEDIRKFLYNLGGRQSIRTLMSLFAMKHTQEPEKAKLKQSIMPIVMACMQMSKGRVGALIVMERNQRLNDIVATGDVIDANVNQRLIENIFFKNSPLHDGAMVIADHRIKAAGCILPVSHDLDIPKELGLRHRAALGMSQESDALCIIVSEETGGISIAHNGHFHLRLSAEELEAELTEAVQ